MNCAIDSASLYPTYRKPFDVIFQRAKNEDWSALEDDFRTLAMPVGGSEVFELAF